MNNTLDVKTLETWLWKAACKIHVEIYENRVEIHNSGGLIGNLTVKDLYARSIPRNPLLFGLMQRMELVEKVGSGLLRINKAMKSYHLPSLKIEADKNFFKITFIRPDLQRKTIEERIKEIEASGEKIGTKRGENPSDHFSEQIRDHCRDRFNIKNSNNYS